MIAFPILVTGTALIGVFYMPGKATSFLPFIICVQVMIFAWYFYYCRAEFQEHWDKVETRAKGIRII